MIEGVQLRRCNESSGMLKKAGRTREGEVGMEGGCRCGRGGGRWVADGGWRVRVRMGREIRSGIGMWIGVRVEMGTRMGTLGGRGGQGWLFWLW